MKCNVGNREKYFRVLGGVIVLIAGVYFTAWWGFFSIYFFLTGILRWCPVNSMLKINNCKAYEHGNPLEK